MVFRFQEMSTRCYPKISNPHWLYLWKHYVASISVFKHVLMQYELNFTNQLEHKVQWVYCHIAYTVSYDETTVQCEIFYKTCMFTSNFYRYSWNCRYLLPKNTIYGTKSVFEPKSESIISKISLLTYLNTQTKNEAFNYCRKDPVFSHIDIIQIKDQHFYEDDYGILVNSTCWIWKSLKYSIFILSQKSIRYI